MRVRNIFDYSTLEILFCCTVAFLLIFYLGKRHKKRYQYPPGPRGLPLFGIFLDIYNYPAHLAYTEWKKAHGGIFTVSIMGRKAVILNDIDSIKEALLSCSPKIDSKTTWRYCFIELLRGLSVMPYSKKWINTRRRTVSILRDYGMGKSFMEPQIYEETHALISNILENNNNGAANIDMKNRVRRTPVNIICSMLFSERYDYEDSNLMFILETMEDLLTYLRTASIHDSLPNFLRPLMKGRLREFHRKIELLNLFLASKVKEHEETYNDKKQRDFVDAWIMSQKLDYIKATKSYGGNGSAHSNGVVATKKLFEYEHESYSHVVNVLQDVLIAGAHSTGFAMNWLIMLLTLHRDIQEEVHEAIMEKLGPEGIVSMADRARLPIVEAVIYETLRISCLVPLVGHACVSDVTLGGYHLPSGAEVTYNNWAVNFDETNFPSAKSFLPHRWIKEDGSFDRKATGKFFPFSIGNRSCAGATLAKMELFLVTTTLFQNLDFLMPDDTASPKFQPEIKHLQSFVLEPKPYLVRVRKRPTFVEKTFTKQNTKCGKLCSRGHNTAA